MSESINGSTEKQIGNYHILGLIGRGGFADVYLGEHVYLKTQAAIKLIRHRVSDSDLEDILNEARTIAQLEHPHIVRVLECSVQDDRPFLVMTYAPKGTLRQRFPKGSRLQPELVLSYAQQMASALQYAHDQKLIHRDIKPENMLIGQEEQLLLSDFGLVMVAHTSRSQVTNNDTAGTVTYMSPEQLQGRPRFASDQYALGIVTYEWICGARPFNGSFVEVASQHVLAPIPSLLAQVPDLPPSVEQVVFKALAKDPAARFENVEAFAQALTRAYIDAFPTMLITPESNRLLGGTSSISRQSLRSSSQQGSQFYPASLSGYSTAQNPSLRAGPNSPPDPHAQRTSMIDPVSGPQSFYQQAPPISQASTNFTPPMMRGMTPDQFYQPAGTVMHPPVPVAPGKTRPSMLLMAVLLLTLLVVVGGSVFLGFNLLSPRPTRQNSGPNGTGPGTFIPNDSGNSTTPTVTITITPTNTPTNTPTAGTNGAPPAAIPTVGITPTPTSIKQVTPTVTPPVSKPTLTPTTTPTPQAQPSTTPIILPTITPGP